MGKSALFNKLTGGRRAITDDTPGVTRDILYGEAEWRGVKFTLSDSGGISGEDGQLPAIVTRQALDAAKSADAVIFVTDVSCGVTEEDERAAAAIRKLRKPTVLACNKCDGVGAVPADIYSFYSLGLGDPVAVSALHGHGTGDLLDRVFELCPPAPADESGEGIKVAIIGRPNAGKSSLLNRLCGSDRAIVSPAPGTTRDTVNTEVTVNGDKFLFVDTAGLRRQAGVTERIERFSVLRAKEAVERADVCVLVIDGAAGFAEQDAKIAGLATDAGKGLVVAVNKWDLAESAGLTVEGLKSRLAEGLSFCPWAPAEFISAKTGRRVGRLPELIKAVSLARGTRIPTGLLNDCLTDATERQQPPSDKGRRLKIYYMTETSVAPPTFTVFCNRKDLFHFSYLRYIENTLRETFDFTGTPIRFVLRERGETGGQSE